MERFTRRRLRARNYRTPVTIACSASSGTAALTGTGISGNVQVGDDAVGVGLQVGSQVTAVDTGITLNRNTTAALSGVSVTFGSAPIRMSGEGQGGRFRGGGHIELYLPEYPLVK